MGWVICVKNQPSKWVISMKADNHKGGSLLRCYSVQKLLEQRRGIHVFWRGSNEALFEDAGRARAVEVADTWLLELLWSFDAPPIAELEPPVRNCEQITRGEHHEGALRQVLVNAYERDRTARQACVNYYYGCACIVCD
jgi:hypothetical protein